MTIEGKYTMEPITWVIHAEWSLVWSSNTKNIWISQSNFIHCFCHSLNLAVEDCSMEILMMGSALDNIQQLSNLIHFSPKRRDLFERSRLSFDLNRSRTASFVSYEVICPNEILRIGFGKHFWKLCFLLLLVTTGNVLGSYNQSKWNSYKVWDVCFDFCHCGLHQVFFINRSAEYNLTV